MLPDYLYTPFYHHVMLLVVIASALIYWCGPGYPSELRHFNLVATVLVGVGVILFIGLRPVSWVFIDMGGYAWSYERVQQGGTSTSGDPLFNGLMRLCGPFLSTKGWFVVCAFIYVAPLALAAWRVHGAWLFPVFLAFLTAFSFWAYGVNGVRNGMACSVLIMAFAFYDKPVVMLPLMAAACGIHASVLLPAVAFLIVRYVSRTEIWLIFWVACVLISLAAGNVGEMLLSRYNPFAWDSRAEEYIVGSEGGFRPDFIAYSIISVLATLLLAAPTRARLRRIAARVIPEPTLNWTRNRKIVGANRVEMGMLARQDHGVVGRAFNTGVAPAGSAGISPVVYFSGETPPEPAAGTVAVHRFSGRSVRASLAEGRKTSRGQEHSTPRAGLRQNGWNSLPWVQFLSSDPFYARLVNTYLLANAVWILVIHATCSNRFAYLSWFMMPWVLIYPFVPGRSNCRPRTGLIATVLFAHFLVTYLMVVVVYPLRGGGYM
jgi:hypothetical protein